MVPLVPGYHISIVPILYDNYRQLFLKSLLPSDSTFSLDDYSYLIVDEASRTCLAVDPADANLFIFAIFFLFRYLQLPDRRHSFPHVSGCRSCGCQFIYIFAIFFLFR